MSGGLTVAVGHDLVYVPEFRHRLRPRFIERAYTAAEAAASEEAHDPAVFFASRWAAKEAAYKALCDLALRSDHTLGGLACFRDYEVVRRPGSRVPALLFHGSPAQLLEALGAGGAVSAGVSLTDEHEYVAAFVTIVRMPTIADGVRAVRTTYAGEAA